MKRRLVSFATIKSLDDDQRVIEGWASRPEVDRHGDIVESKGLLPLKGKLPLLVDHNHSQAVGTVESVKAGNDGVRFTARFAKVLQGGALKEMCDDAWQMVKQGLRSAVSIGFKAEDYEPMSNGGWRFTSWELLEISLVAVPACAGATIDQVKAIDRELRNQNKRFRVVRLADPIPGTRAATGTIASAVSKASAGAQEDLELYRAIKAMGPQNYVAESERMAAEIAADQALADIRARLAKLEGKR